MTFILIFLYVKIIYVIYLLRVMCYTKVQDKLNERLIFLEAKPEDDILTYLTVVSGDGVVVNVSNQSVLVRTVSVNDNWYVCLLSSLCCRSWSQSQSAVLLSHQPALIGRSQHRWKAWRTINVVAMDVNHGQVESDLIGNIKYVALPWTLQHKTSCHFHGQLLIFYIELLV